MNEDVRALKDALESLNKKEGFCQVHVFLPKNSEIMLNFSQNLSS